MATLIDSIVALLARTPVETLPAPDNVVGQENDGRITFSTVSEANRNALNTYFKNNKVLAVTQQDKVLLEELDESPGLWTNPRNENTTYNHIIYKGTVYELPPFNPNFISLDLTKEQVRDALTQLSTTVNDLIAKADLPASEKIRKVLEALKDKSSTNFSEDFQFFVTKATLDRLRAYSHMAALELATQAMQGRPTQSSDGSRVLNKEVVERFLVQPDT